MARTDISWIVGGENVKTIACIADNSTITYDAAQPGGSAAVGKAVSMSGNKTVKLAADAEAVLGKLLFVDKDLKCTVQYSGPCQLPSSGTITRGTGVVGALLSSAPGYVRSPVAATVAESTIARGFVGDVAVALAVDIIL